LLAMFIFRDGRSLLVDSENEIVEPVQIMIDPNGGGVVFKLVGTGVITLEEDAQPLAYCEEIDHKRWSRGIREKQSEVGE
jgi:hypothetical protein